MKKLFFILFLITFAYSFDIDKIPPCDQKLIISTIMHNYDEPPQHIRKYILKKWGIAPFEDEIVRDTITLDTVAKL